METIGLRKELKENKEIDMIIAYLEGVYGCKVLNQTVCKKEPQLLFLELFFIENIETFLSHLDIIYIDFEKRSISVCIDKKNIEKLINS